jgi:hypothetical protein
MLKERMQVWGYLALFLIVFFLVVSFFKISEDPDVGFTRGVLKGLVSGKESVQDSIDWPFFKALGSDVGSEYLKLARENERSYFRKAFILNLALSFQNSGGRYSSFTRWRIFDRQKDKVIVASDVLPSRKTILFTVVKKYRRRKLTQMQWKE